jgi:hypothetical protein
MKTFMNITNYRSKSSNPLSAVMNGSAIVNQTAATSAIPVSTTGFNQS